MHTASAKAATGQFRHQAVVYRGLSDFVSATVPFIEEGLERREPVLVATLPDRIRSVRSALGHAAERVGFLDMEQVGGNPGRIIPVWQRFVRDSVAQGSARGIGEPVWSGRRGVEIEECRLHEALLNLAFDGGPAWQLMCPYDADALPAAVIADATRTHPVVSPSESPESEYAGHELARTAFASPLPPEPDTARHLSFACEDLRALRGVVRAWALEAGLPHERADHLVVAANELATNSVVHGGGKGDLRSWTEPGALVVQVSDDGRISDPLVGRHLALGAAQSGRGVWMVNQLCDLVQVRSGETGTVVRMHSWL